MGCDRVVVWRWEEFVDVVNHGLYVFQDFVEVFFIVSPSRTLQSRCCIAMDALNSLLKKSFDVALHGWGDIANRGDS